MRITVARSSIDSMRKVVPAPSDQISTLPDQREDAGGLSMASGSAGCSTSRPFVTQNPSRPFTETCSRPPLPIDCFAKRIGPSGATICMKASPTPVSPISGSVPLAG